MDAAAAKAARKEAKRKKKEAKLLKRKLEGGRARGRRPVAGRQEEEGQEGEEAGRGRSRAAPASYWPSSRRWRGSARLTPPPRAAAPAADEPAADEADAADAAPAEDRAQAEPQQKKSDANAASMFGTLTFDALPLAEGTQESIKKMGFGTMTKIQERRDPAVARRRGSIGQREDGLGQDARVPRADGIVAASSFFVTVAVAAAAWGERRGWRETAAAPRAPRGPPRRASSAAASRGARRRPPKPKARPVGHRREVESTARRREAEARARQPEARPRRRGQPADDGPRWLTRATPHTDAKKNTTKKTQVDLLTKARFQQNSGLGGLVISPTRALSDSSASFSGNVALRELGGRRSSGARSVRAAGERHARPARPKIGGANRRGEAERLS